MRYELWMYSKMAAMAIRSKMQYKADFWAGVVGVFVLNGLNLSQLGVLIYRFQTLGGWSMWELMFLYSLFMICRSIYTTFFARIESLEDDIAQGAFDQYLTRPVSPLLQLFGQDIRYVGGADLLFGIACFTLSSSVLQPVWGWMHLVWLIVFIISGTMVETSLALICSSAAFSAVRVGVLHDINMRLKLITQQYPIGIFGKAFRVLVTGFIPVAYINYYPAVFLLGKAGVPQWLCLLSPAVAALIAGLALWAWHSGIKRYSSTGS